MAMAMAQELAPVMAQELVMAMVHYLAPETAMAKECLFGPKKVGSCSMRLLQALHFCPVDNLCMMLVIMCHICLAHIICRQMK